MHFASEERRSVWPGLPWGGNIAWQGNIDALERGGADSNEPDSLCFVENPRLNRVAPAGTDLAAYLVEVLILERARDGIKVHAQLHIAEPRRRKFATQWSGCRVGLHSC